MSLRDLFQTPAPDVAVEIDHTHVAAARLAWRGGQAVISAHASEPLPAGLVVPGLAALNMADVPALSQAIARDAGAARRRQAVARLAGRARHGGEGVAAQAREGAAEGRRTCARSCAGRCARPRRSRSSRRCSAFQPGARGADGGSEFVVAAVARGRHSAVRTGLPDGGRRTPASSICRPSASSTACSPSAAAPPGDWLLVHVTDTYLTLAVMRDSALLFFRNRGEERGHARGPDSPDGDVLRGSPARRRLRARADRRRGAPARRRGHACAAASKSGCRISVESVDPRGAAGLQDRIGASAELLDVLAPLVGMLMRERKAA